MFELSLLSQLFGLPMAILGLLIAFRKEIYDSVYRYSHDLDEYVTAEVESADSVTPQDVHEWSITLHSAAMYRRGCDATMYVGYGCAISWFLSVLVSRVDPFGLGSWSPPVVPATTATMAVTFSLGLLSLLVVLIGALFYVDHTRGETVADGPAEKAASDADA